MRSSSVLSYRLYFYLIYERTVCACIFQKSQNLISSASGGALLAENFCISSLNFNWERAYASAGVFPLRSASPTWFDASLNEFASSSSFGLHSLFLFVRNENGSVYPMYAVVPCFTAECPTVVAESQASAYTVVPFRSFSFSSYLRSGSFLCPCTVFASPCPLRNTSDGFCFLRKLSNAVLFAFSP